MWARGQFYFPVEWNLTSRRLGFGLETLILQLLMEFLIMVVTRATLKARIEDRTQRASLVTCIRIEGKKTAPITWMCD